MSTISVKSYIKFNGSYLPSNDTGIEAYTGWYSSGNASNRFSLNVYGADYNTDTQKFYVYYRVKVYKGSEGFSIAAAGTYVNGNEYYRKDPGDPINGAQGSFLSDFKNGSYSNGAVIIYGTFELAASSSSWTVGVKGMCNGGWGWNRWPNNEYCVSNLNIPLSIDSNWRDSVFHVIKFDTHGGTPTANTVYCLPGNSFSLPPAVDWPNVSISATVSLDLMGGTCNTTSLTASGIRDFSFAGWFNEYDYIYRAAGSSYTPTRSETIHADFNYTESYNAVTLPTPTRDNYIFKGWATKSTATSGITGSYTPTDDVTLYATWELDQVVAYVKSGGTWKQGRMYAKINGQWEKVKRTYVKKNGSWVEGD